MATIRRIKSGRYEVQVRRKGQPSASRTFAKRSDADEWARYMETKADRGELPAPISVLDKYTVRDILERYRNEVSIKKKSYDSERHVLNALMRQSFARLTLSEINPSRFADYLDIRLKLVKPGTVRREFALLKHAFDTAERVWNLPVRENPISKMPKIKPQGGRVRRLETCEFERLAEAAQCTRNPLIWPIIRFAVATGMRRGEILRMQWKDLDNKAKVLHIPLAKNGYARTIPLSSHALAVIEELSYTQVDGDPAGLVFPLSENAFKLAWQRLRKRSGIEDLHFHDLRHEAISRFFEMGLAVPEVATISGHRDYRMLFRYTHLKAEDIAKKLNNL